jgi:hypothetical protein
LDVQTIDQEFAQLQQESGAVAQALATFAGKLQTASDGGSTDAKEWLLDLKSLALQVQEEQLQMQTLLQALHGFADTTLQQVAAPSSTATATAPAPAPAPQPEATGMLSRFRGSGFGQAMTQGAGMGAGFAIADSVINSLFN